MQSHSCKSLLFGCWRQTDLGNLYWQYWTHCWMIYEFSIMSVYDNLSNQVSMWSYVLSCIGSRTAEHRQWFSTYLTWARTNQTNCICRTQQPASLMGTLYFSYVCVHLWFVCFSHKPIVQSRVVGLISFQWLKFKIWEKFFMIEQIESGSSTNRKICGWFPGSLQFTRQSLLEQCTEPLSAPEGCAIGVWMISSSRWTGILYNWVNVASSVKTRKVLYTCSPFTI